MKAVVPRQGRETTEIVSGQRPRPSSSLDEERTCLQAIADFFENRWIEIGDCCYDLCHTTYMWKLNPSVQGHGQDTQDTLELLGISSTDRDLLYSLFKELDFYGRNEVSLKAFLKKFHLPPTPFTDRLFALFDNDGSGGVDFKEFVVTLWNLCTFSKQGLKTCVFRMFDTDESGLLDSSEILDMLKAIWGKQYSDSRVARRVAMRLGDYKGTLNVQQFRVFVSKYTAIITPIERIRDILRQKVLGESYWKEAAKKRGVIIERMKREAEASAHEESIGGSDNFCIAGGVDCMTHKHPPDGRIKKKQSQQKKPNVGRSKQKKRRLSFTRALEGEQSNIRLLRTVLWTEGVTLPVTKVFQWALSSNAIPPIKRQPVIQLEWSRTGAAKETVSLSGKAASRVKARKLQENLQLERSSAHARVERVRRHFIDVGASTTLVRDIQRVRSQKADEDYCNLSKNRGKTKAQLKAEQKQRAKKQRDIERHKKEQKEGKYRVDVRSGSSRPSSATPKKEGGARAARPISAARSRK